MKTDMSHERCSAMEIYHGTDGGQIGKGFMTASEHWHEEADRGVRHAERSERGINRPHTYKVVDRKVDGDVTTVRLEYIPPKKTEAPAGG